MSGAFGFRGEFSRQALKCPSPAKTSRLKRLKPTTVGINLFSRFGFWLAARFQPVALICPHFRMHPKIQQCLHTMKEIHLPPAGCVMSETTHHVRYVEADTMALGITAATFAILKKVAVIMHENVDIPTGRLRRHTT